LVPALTVKAGKQEKGYQYQYFMPETISHGFYWTDEAMNELLETASLRMGELNSFSRFVPDTDMFILMHIFKEAVASSRIEDWKPSFITGTSRSLTWSGSPSRTTSSRLSTPSLTATAE
jgi:hypothetical protein